MLVYIVGSDWTQLKVMVDHPSIQITNDRLTLCVSMEFPIYFDTVKSGWSIVYIEGSHIIISKKNIFLSLKINFALSNSVNPDEMPHHAAFSLGLHCLPKHPFRGFWSTKGKTLIN